MNDAHRTLLETAKRLVPCLRTVGPQNVGAGARGRPDAHAGFQMHTGARAPAPGAQPGLRRSVQLFITVVNYPGQRSSGLPSACTLEWQGVGRGCQEGV